MAVALGACGDGGEFGGETDGESPIDAAEAFDSSPITPDEEDDGFTYTSRDAAPQEDDAVRGGGRYEGDAGPKDAGSDGPDASVLDDEDAGETPDAEPEPEPCTEVTWYRDADQDGYGTADTTVAACENPSGYVGNDDDCYDGNALAKPGQTEWFEAHRGDGSFDYDCVNGSEKKFPKQAVCPALDNACPPPNTWASGYSLLACVQPASTQDKCYCDYLGMTAPVPDLIDGWAPLLSSVPACASSAEWSTVPKWNAPTAKYSCDRSYTFKQQLCR